MSGDKIVLITGAASGIGLETARQFITQGSAVIGVDMNDKNLQAAHEALGEKLIPKVCDVTDEKQIASLSEFVSGKFDRLDVLVNNAGRGKNGIAPDNMTEEDYLYHFDVLVKGPMLMVKHFVPFLKKSANPSIINISSLASHIEYSNHFLYSTAKAAVEKYTRNLVRDLPGIRSNAIVPGWIDTPIYTRDTGLDKETVDTIFEFIRKKIPCGRIGKPEDIAHCILFLTSEKASYINGTSVVIDGGCKYGSDWGIM